jgi:hypothetical protein
MQYLGIFSVFLNIWRFAEKSDSLLGGFDSSVTML